MKVFRDSLVYRLVLTFTIGVLFAWVMSEGAFVLLKDSSDHQPQRVELVIPAGTAERVAAGEAEPSIPADMTFVVGDVLVVKNDDVVSHQLGPVWVPSGKTASLTMDQANSYSYACSFEPSQYLGLYVRSRVTMETRMIAIMFAGPPMGVLITLYSLVIWPIRPKSATLADVSV